MDKNSKIYIAGHTGLVGSALNRNLLAKGYKNIIEKKSRSRNIYINMVERMINLENLNSSRNK